MHADAHLDRKVARQQNIRQHLEQQREAVRMRDAEVDIKDASRLQNKSARTEGYLSRVSDKKRLPEFAKRPIGGDVVAAAATHLNLFSDEWNNAGTGHAALCEPNYTPMDPITKEVDISKAIPISTL